LETTTTLTKTTVSDATINLSSVEDQDLTITTAQLLTNVVGSKLSIINLSVVGNNATLIDNNNSTWTLTPKNDFSGKIELSYQISDGGSTTDDATADVNITGCFGQCCGGFQIATTISITGNNLYILTSVCLC
jgi:glutamate synthase domain-containing protein 3